MGKNNKIQPNTSNVSHTFEKVDGYEAFLKIQ